MKKNGIQFLRGVLILLVVYIHSNTTSYMSTEEYYLSILVRTIANIAVPVFFFLSGFFFNEEKYYLNKSYLFNKIKRLFIPWMLYYIAYQIPSWVHNGFSLKSLYRFLILSNVGHLYYIVVLIQLLLLTPLLLKINHKNGLIKYIIMICTVIYLIIYRFLWLGYDFILPLHEVMIFGWILYYLLGLFFKDYFSKKKTKHVHFYLLFFIFTFVYNSLIYRRFGITYALSQMNVVNVINSLAFIFFVFPYFLNQDIKANFITKIGDRSFGIYLIHVLIINLFGVFIDICFFYQVIIESIIVYFITYAIIEIFSTSTRGKLDLILGLK